MKRILYILSLFFVINILVSCSKTPPPAEYSWKVITKEQAFNFLYYSNNVKIIYGPILSSDPYSVPTIKWIENVYSPALKNWLFSNQILVAKENNNNCTKFSSYGQTVGHLIHYRQNQNTQKTSLAIGVVDYQAYAWEGHSINCFIVANEFGDLKICYYEPQTQKIMTKEEVDWVESTYTFMRF